MSHEPLSLDPYLELIETSEPVDYLIALTQQITGPDLEILAVQRPSNPAREPLVVRGRLLRPSQEVYERWLAEFKRRGYTPMLRRAPDRSGDVLLQVVPGVVRPAPSDPRINAVLFALTLVSTLWVGAINNLGLEGGLFPRSLAEWALGIPFAATLLSILVAHEFGHYFAARYHRVAVSLPYFIPMPLGFGTLGAFIKMKEPVSNRRKLFDIGVAGPLAGLVLALPLLVYGLSTSPATVPPPHPGAMLEGNSILYYTLKLLVFGQPLPNPATGVDVLLNDVAFAAWIGLLVTALNLLPVGQLDGGHTVFALFGPRARSVNLAAMAGMLVLGIAGLPPIQALLPGLVDVGWTGWFIWLLLIGLIGGPFHPPTLDDVTELDGRRRWLGYLVLFIFVITFVPVPLRPL